MWPEEDPVGRPCTAIPKGSEVNENIFGDLCLLGIWRVHKTRHFIRPTNTFAKEKNSANGCREKKLKEA